MASLAIYIIIILALAAVAVIVGIILYNRHLDKITQGEERDTHSSIPEPAATVSTTYKVVLMIMMIISLLSVGTLRSEITTLRSTINNLQSSQNSLYQEIYELRSELENQNKQVSLSEWKIKNPDMAKYTAEVEFSASLKNFTEETTVSLILTRDETYTEVFPLNQVSPGTYAGTIPVGLFAMYENALLTMDNGENITTEPVDFPTFCFYDFFPMPGIDSHFGSSMKGNKLEYDGAFTVLTDDNDAVSRVELTYVTGGEDLKTIDITQDVLNHKEIQLEQGLPLKHDLTLRISLTTKDGFRIETSQLALYEAAPDAAIEDGYERIYSPEGDLLWENPKYE